jgi:hypothetical protein
MPGHSSSKNGVASLAYVSGIHAVAAKNVDGRDKPGHDEKASHFQAIGKSLKMLDAFSVGLSGWPALN